MRWLFGFTTGLVLMVSAGAALAQTTTTQATATPAPAASQALSQFLADTPKPPGPEADSPYAAVPPEFDSAVRALAMDNYSSATAQLEKIYSAAAEKSPERIRAAMWLGLAYGTRAMNYPTDGWQTGTSATAYLKEAIAQDPQVLAAPDTARVLAEMVAHGWGSEDPATALQRAEQKAEETRRPLDFYFAGVISRRLSARAWGYSDTTAQDQKTLSLFAKAIARDPSRYETWSAYLPALLPAGMHDLATSEALVMYHHFENLRTPLLAEQGPAVLMLSVSSYRTTEKDKVILDAVEKKWPDNPMPDFELAMRDIETSPARAMEAFPALIKRFEAGDVKPLPREAGYYPSTLYKYAFLLQSMGSIEESLEVYKKVQKVSPAYAEVNMNIAILLAQLSDKETTGPKKLALLEQAREYAEAQEKHDYRGRAALKAGEMRQRLRSIIFRMKQAMQNPKTEDQATTR